MFREIITFQFGNYANYVGAHWWNIQESSFVYDQTAVSSPSEINHDVLFREGVDYAGATTYTPRLLVVDLQGSLKHLPEEGTLYKHPEPSTSNSISTNIVEQIKDSIQWNESDVEVIEKDKIIKPDFQKDLDNPDLNLEEKEYNFSENVQAWTDYLYTRYHPRTINLVQSYQHSDNVEKFDTFTNGIRIWKDEGFENDFADRIRQYIEECDNCQGFQTIFDCTNAFSGISLKSMEHLNDEYGKSNFAVPVFSSKKKLFESADDAMTDSISVVNIALTYSKLSEQCSLFLPLSINDREWRQKGNPREFSNVKYNYSNLYETSGILASYLDTVTLRYRFQNPVFSNYLPGFCSDMTNYGRKLAAAAFAFPLKMRDEQDLIDALDHYDPPFFTQLSPNSKIGSNYIIQSVCCRGVPKTRLKRPFNSAQLQMSMAAYKCETVSEMLQLYFQCENHASLAHVSAVETPLTIRNPYPRQIFQPQLNFKGFLSDRERSPEQNISSLPTVASVQSSGDLADTLESLHREAARIKLSKLHRFKETGLEADEYAETLESLLQFKDHYEDNYEL